MTRSAEQKEQILNLWREGKSAREIAQNYPGMTRNVVIGLAFRAGLKREKLPGPPRVSLPRQPAAHKRPKVFLVGSVAFVAPKARAPRAITRDASFAPLPGSTPKHFLERGPGSCCWPIGEELLSCCEPTENHHYCPEHRAISIAQTQPKHPEKPPMLRFGARVAA